MERLYHAVNCSGVKESKLFKNLFLSRSFHIARSRSSIVISFFKAIFWSMFLLSFSVTGYPLREDSSNISLLRYIALFVLALPLLVLLELGSMYEEYSHLCSKR